MNSGEVHARHYGTRRPIKLTWRDGRIVSLVEVAAPPAEETWIAPPLMDLQVNGYAGVDFQQDELTVEELLHAVRQLRADGCTRFLLTLVTDEWSRLTARFRHLRDQRQRHPELMAAVLGWHLEGPFLSAEPGYCGAHDPALMLDPTDAHLDELRAIAGQTPLLLTMAPERRGALEVIARARQHGVIIQLGHTNASRHELALATGEHTAFTHLGNACPQCLDRHDNIVWRVLQAPDLWTSVIPDGVHVSPALFQIIHRVKGEQVYYTTDAMSAAGAPPGRYRLGRLTLEVGADGIVRHPGQSNFAGSSCTPLRGVFTAAEMLGEPWQATWRRFSETPAKILKMENTLEPGRSADFVVYRTGGPPAQSAFEIYCGGIPTPGHRGEKAASTPADSRRSP